MGSVQGRNSLELFYLKCSVFGYSNRQISSPPAETSRKRIFPVRMHGRKDCNVLHVLIS